MSNKMPKKAQVRFANHFLKEHGIDPQTVDTQALMDPEAHYDENLGELKRRLGIKTKNELLEEIQKYEEIERERKAKHFREEFRKTLKVIKDQGLEVEEYYKALREYVKAVIYGEQDSLIIYSSAGLGKSYQILSVFEEENLKPDEDYAILSSFTTPLSFYNFAYRNRDKILFLDDIEGIINNRIALSILKAMTWAIGESRVVRYRSTTQKLEAPEEFEFKGKVIMTLNKKGDIPELEAVISRSLYYELDITYEDLMGGLLPKIATQKLGDEGLEIVNFIGEHTDPSSNIDIRTLMKAIDLYNYAKENGTNWKFLVENILSGDRDLQLVWRLMKGGKPVNEKVRDFREKTGKSRRTFYRYRKKLQEKIKPRFVPK